MFVPNWVELYGSQYTETAKDESNDENAYLTNKIDKCYHYELRISKSGLKALDQPTERCDSGTKDPNTSECIERYIEDEIGCSINIKGGRTTADMPPCTLRSEKIALKNITRKLQEASANKIYEMTGCLASCQRNEYAKIDGNLLQKYCYPYDGPYDLHLEFKITQGSYKEEEQYIIYDFNSFIGESGGILGLLLGCSFLSLYNELGYLLGRFKPSALFK